MHLRKALGARATVAAMALAAAIATAGCGESLDVANELLVTQVTTGWFDSGVLEDGKNKLVPTISFQLTNGAQDEITTVQVNGVFRRVEEDDQEWGDAFVRAIGADGLPAGDSTQPIVMRSGLGYTSDEPRLEMFQHRLFMDAKVELFAKHHGAPWVKLGEYVIDRQLLTN
ncbi:MAG: hypothetical protein QF463_03760 [Vicinamibacterales bacterium]|jgi:hypothetical protein|nr:hypothetical protein [Acidobacteriota bacterium]MDP6374183.1 hypothetical protein [Vicinamibacterales bacterium]MDP6608161.1 hypothetical protein [Vicinamibacterales bacterium]HAK56253.1 hypothetical protein [Acidobacteriota bacterium]|tara:strand:+ start:158 stop:670 length:513 start_codon:yes stop_codon:yes gene_type:complete